MSPHAASSTSQVYARPVAGFLKEGGQSVLVDAKKKKRLGGGGAEEDDTYCS